MTPDELEQRRNDNSFRRHFGADLLEGFKSADEVIRVSDGGLETRRRGGSNDEPDEKQAVGNAEEEIRVLKAQVVKLEETIERIPAIVWWLQDDSLTAAARHVVNDMIPHPFHSLQPAGDDLNIANAVVKVDLEHSGGQCYIGEVGGSSSSSITGRAINGAETDCNTDTAKPWVRYRKSTYAFSEETVGPAVPCDPDYIYFRKANWYGGEIVIQ